MLVYVAGAYKGDVTKNIAAARKVAIELWESGYAVICPHLNTAHFEQDCKVEHEVYLNGDLEIVQRCDAVVVVPNWKNSEGTKAEIEYANVRGIPVYYYPDKPVILAPLNTSPIQCTTFMDTIMTMYRVHLEKNSDYSPANILGTGEVGLVTRIWDKVARLMNLSGFKLQVGRGEFRTPLKAKNESINDTLMDLAVYSIIAMLYRRDAWGK